MIRTYRHSSIRAGFAAVFLLVMVASAFACRIPVFRYALERWPPGMFELVVLHSGEMTAEQSDVLKQLDVRLDDKNSPVNLRVAAIDVSGESLSRDDRLLVAATGVDPSGLDAPIATLLFPRSRGETTVAWQGDLSSENLTSVIDSPARQEIIESILDGESAVWVLIEGTDAAANDEAATLLEDELGRIAELIKLPPKDVLEADEEFQATTTIDLRIGFKLLRLKRDDPAESAFVEMLLNSESDLATFDDPIAIPVFGRGRTYYALVGKGIKPKLIEANSRFVCGDCSCQVKEENPGSDLLFAADWDEGIRGTAFPEQVLPELTGIGSIGEIDLTEYERAVTEASDSSAAVANANSGDGTPAKQSIRATDAGSASAAEVTALGKTSSDGEIEKSADALSAEPLQVEHVVWKSLLPVVGLALIVAIAGALLLRS